MLERLPDRGTVATIGCFAAIAIAVLAVSFPHDLPWLLRVPDGLLLPVSEWLNALIRTVNDNFRGVFRALSGALDWQMRLLQSILQAIPWSVMLVVVSLAALRGAGARLGALTAITCVYIVLSGYWKESIDTLTLVAFGLPIACALGAALGILAHSSRAVAPVVDGVLDVMQTVPAFAYLVPLIVLFGFGPVAGLIASILFALPPMARNVKVGLDNTPSETIEAAKIAGCSRLQIFAFVRVGAAGRQIMMGLNQTIMATLSMVIFAAVIGGFEDIGWEVLRAARRAEFGNGMIAGLVVTLLAVLLDRVSEAAFKSRTRGIPQMRGRTYWGLVFAAGALTWLLLSPLLPEAHALSIRPFVAQALDNAVSTVSVSLAAVTDGIKGVATTYFLLPLRIGLSRTVTAEIWGFSMGIAVTVAYVAAVSGAALFLAMRDRKVTALGVLFAGLLLYTGFTGLPWLPLSLGLGLIGWWLGGAKLAALTLSGLFAIAAAGLWPSAMISAYLTAAAIITSIVGGGLFGVLAAEHDGVSRALRPVNDLLQTIPPFVILIPLIVFFQVGDFSSYLAIVAYAIVPMIRYTEKGLRNVPVTQVEAGQLAGCTPLQLLTFVKLPAARNDLLLGLNQTVMAALAMLSVAALVGSRGLGQDVYVALSKADPGFGLAAGLSIAALAMMTDRFVRRIAV